MKNLLIIAMLMACPAIAQTPGGFSTGAILTAPGLNSALAAKQDFAAPGGLISEIPIHPSTFGAKCDGTTDDTTAFRAAIAAALASSRVVEMGVGQCIISGNGLVFDFTAGLDFGGAVVMRGQGPNLSQIIFATPTSNSSAAITVNAGVPPAGQTRATFQGFAVLRQFSGNTGVCMSLINTNAIALRDVWLNNCDTGLKAVDTFNVLLDNVTVDRNKTGIDATRGTNSSPNAWTMIAPKIRFNYLKGAHFQNPTTLTILGGNIESNGVGSASPSTAIALHIDGGPRDGSVGLMMSGVYLEANTGLGDVVFTQDNYAGLHLISGSTFQRIGTSAVVTQHILVQKNNGAFFTIKLMANAFASFAGYVPGSTPVINVAASPVGTNWKYVSDTNVFQNAGETPAASVNYVFQ
jgi:hypothetical protein